MDKSTAAAVAGGALSAKTLEIAWRWIGRKFGYASQVAVDAQRELSQIREELRERVTELEAKVEEGEREREQMRKLGSDRDDENKSLRERVKQLTDTVAAQAESIANLKRQIATLKRKKR